jgi:hypothetical protein
LEFSIFLCTFATEISNGAEDNFKNNLIMNKVYQVVSYIPLNTIAYLRDKQGCIRECRCVGVKDEGVTELGSHWEVAGFIELGNLHSDNRIYINGIQIGVLFCSEEDAQFQEWNTPINKLYKKIPFSDVMAKCYPSVKIHINLYCYWVKVWSVENQVLREINATFNFYFNDDGELSVYVKELEELTCYATKEDAINHFPKVDVIRLNGLTKIGNEEKFVTIKVEKKRWDDFKRFVDSVK